jgi:hypothetical protein
LIEGLGGICCFPKAAAFASFPEAGGGEMVGGFDGIGRADLDLDDDVGVDVARFVRCGAGDGFLVAAAQFLPSWSPPPRRVTSRGPCLPPLVKSRGQNTKYDR